MKPDPPIVQDRPDLPVKGEHPSCEEEDVVRGEGLHVWPEVVADLELRSPVGRVASAGRPISIGGRSQRGLRRAPPTKCTKPFPEGPAGRSR